MQVKELENQINFLLSIAIDKCSNLEDARDLTQETLFAALDYCQKGGEISNIKGWLLTVLNRNYYGVLRKKYKMPKIYIGDDFDIADTYDSFEQIEKTEEAEMIRREVAYLTELYRLIIVRYYFYNESIEKISSECKIPEGTVKSRLDYGRKQLKKGLICMENYTENSYMPQKLYVRNSGHSGLNDEPMSLVPDDDRLSQNLLILAYKKPVTITELAKTIGIPTAYIENTINKLVDGELMKRMGDGKVYTDFIIYDPEDYIKYIKDQEQFASDNAAVFCEPMEKAIENLKLSDFYSERLERYMIINIASSAQWNSLQPHVKPQIFPERPYGGAWIAFGSKYPENYQIPDDKKGKEEYSLSGQRDVQIDEYLGSKNICMLNYETSLYQHHKHDGFGYSNFGELELDMLKLFYLIKKNISPETVGFNPKMIKNIPLMAERGMIKITDGKPELLIPCLTHAQYNEYNKIRVQAIDTAAAALSKPMGEYIKTRKKSIPPHLKSVPDQKLLNIPPAMVLVFEAINHGVIKRNLGYPCPETILVID